MLSWPVEIRRLSGYRVLAFDLPGHGKSGGVASQNLAEIQRAVFRFLREAGVLSMVLVAHSLGAAAAVDFALNNPDQVKGLALLSAAPRFTIPTDILQAVSDAETYSIGLAIMRQRFFSPRTPVQLRNRILASLEKQRSTILYSDFLSAAGVDLRNNASMIECPTWIANGKQDLITPPSICSEWKQVIRFPEFREFPSAGHMLPLEKPAAVAEGLQYFLIKHNHFSG